MAELKDSIDFGRMSIPRLFRKIFIPTLLGMVFNVLFILTDGIFVGQGIGSDALAAINISSPLFLLNAGLAQLFGVGGSIVASIHLSRSKRKVARITTTQAMTAMTLITGGVSLLVMLNLEKTALFLGGEGRLMPLITEYMNWFVPFLLFNATLGAGMFFIRLSGAPKYAMMCNIVAACINILFDWLFILHLQMGMMGAGLATSLGYVVGATMVTVYLFRRKANLRYIPIKTHLRSLRLTFRNLGYMARLGTSSFLTNFAVGVMMFVGNAVFMEYLGEDGVAAYSIACYLMPIVTIVYSAIVLSSQPIMSYNYGANQPRRVKEALQISLATAMGCAAVVIAIFVFATPLIVGMFIDPACKAFEIAVNGLPYFSAGFVFLGINVVAIGYFQSLERGTLATVLTLLRGIVFLLVGFWIMPRLLHVPGIWLSLPMAEFLTFVVVLGLFMAKKKRNLHKTAI